MKILLFTDNHYCKNSSIIRGRGQEYSLRLENQIQSLNWMEQVAQSSNCDMIICLGDFFDKSILTDEELTALKEIKWNTNIKHYFLVGNHESSVNSLRYNSVTALLNNNFTIIDKPTREVGFGYDILLLPYIIEDNRKSLKEYWSSTNNVDYVTQEVKNRIILSHNDIKGIQMGSIISKDGFDINEIETSCKLFINGHIHNGTQFCKNGFNLGNLTGQNFGENAFTYSHKIAILDTSNLNLTFIENPYAFNFYKIEINNETEFNILLSLKDNSIVSIKCKDTLVDKLKNYLDYLNNIICYKITTVYSETISENNYDDLTVDHLNKFIEFCKEKLGNLEVVNDELKEICK